MNAHVPVRGRKGKLRPRIAEAEREETLGEIIWTATHQPHRRGYPEPRDWRLGYPIGRLWLAKRIRHYQHHISFYFVNVYRYNAIIRGWPRIDIRSALGSFFTDRGTSIDQLDESRAGLSDAEKNRIRARIRRARWQWDEIQSALRKGSFVGYDYVDLLRKVLIEERDPTEIELWHLKRALNILAGVRESDA